MRCPLGDDVLQEGKAFIADCQAIGDHVMSFFYEAEFWVIATPLLCLLGVLFFVAYLLRTRWAYQLSLYYGIGSGVVMSPVGYKPSSPTRASRRQATGGNGPHERTTQNSAELGQRNASPTTLDSDDSLVFPIQFEPGWS